MAWQLGLTVAGILSILFIIGWVLLFGVAIWAFVDAIMMFTAAVTDSDGRQLR